jgi:hypothetical protein
MNDELITLSDGRVVSKKDYIKAKTLDLIEFGYSGLTEKEVEEQLNKVLKRKEHLSIVGMMIEDDIEVPKR